MYVSYFPTAQRRPGLGQVPHDVVRINAAGGDHEAVAGRDGDGSDGGVVEAVATDLAEELRVPDDNLDLYSIRMKKIMHCKLLYRSQEVFYNLIPLSKTIQNARWLVFLR